MNGLLHQWYVVDLYHQPEGCSQPIVKEHHRIGARSDEEAIRGAHALFMGRDLPLLTGFAVRSIGSRRFGDQVIYRHDKVLPVATSSTRSAAPAGITS